MKLGSLFDGSGTCPLAASAVGIIPAWASEIEPFPMAVTQSRFPKMKHLGDITKMNGGEIEPVDVITFGSPCQNLSIAGNRKGLAGEQSSLFLEAVRIIKEMRCATNGRYPQIAIWENVYGAFSSNDGEDFRVVLESLWQVCEGDDSVPRFEETHGKQRWPKSGCIVGDSCSIAWRGLNAEHWGVSQRRKRVFVVLDLGGQCAAQILFERKGLSRDFKAVRGKRKAAGRSSQNGSAEHRGVYALDHHPQDKRVSIRGDGVIQTLAGRMGTGGGNIPLILIPVTYQQESYDEYGECDTAPTLKASGGNYGGGTEVLTLQPIGVDLFSAALTGERTMTICAARSDHKHLPCVAVPYTLKIRGGCAGGGKGALIQKDKSATLACGNDQTLFVPTQTESGEAIYLVRKLTPTECASLQGFEKDWCALVPHKDAAEYKMWGNGMAFPCMLYIMEGVQRVLAQRQLENLFGGGAP